MSRYHHLIARAGHYALLVLVWAVLCLPHLGAPSLWDIDEGNNAECAQEMNESGNFIVPTFNYKLRIDKPILLYWLQVPAYRLFGVNEFAARLPSALASLLAVLVLYELSRRLFRVSTAFLAGLVLASNVAFCAAAHFANPDALLNLCSLLALWCFWNHYQRTDGGGWWLLGCGVACGMGMLAKGPVALLLPSATALLFLLWRRDMRRLWDMRVLGASLLFVLVAAPWYVWVGVETKGEWLYGFFWKHNIERGFGVMENHGGPFFYYFLVLIAGLMPWSVFLGPTAFFAVRNLLASRRSRIDQPSQVDSGQRIAECGMQFLLCWLVVWFAFFTVARTKLPNYILPAYPAVALLTASFLDDWRLGRIVLPRWVMPASLTCLAVAGVCVSVGLLIAGDAIPVALRGRRLPGLANGAWLGGVFLSGALVSGWYLWRGRRGGLILGVTTAGVVFAAALAFWGAGLVDRFKAPRVLAQSLPDDFLYREVRVGAFGYFQPSLVFYCQREVYCPNGPIAAIEFLHTALPVYLFVSEEMWEQLRNFAPSSYRLLARHRDLYNGREVLLVTNDPLN